MYSEGGLKTDDSLIFRIFTNAGALLFALFFIHCAGVIPIAKKVQYPTEVTAQMRSDFDQAEGFYLRRQFDEAFHAYQRYIDTYDYNRLTDEAFYKQGKVHFLKRGYSDAAARFQQLAERSPDPQYRAKGQHMLGYAAYKGGDATQAFATLSKVKSDLLPPLLRIQYYSLLIHAADGSNQNREQSDYAALRLYDLYEDQGRSLQQVNAPDILSFSQVKGRIEAFIATPIVASELPSWMRKYPTGPARGFVDYKIARTYYDAGDTGKARRLLTAFVNSYPKNKYAEGASALLQELGGPEEGLAVGEHIRVGVLIPMEGALATGFGDAVLRGVKCAAGTGGLCGGDGNAELLVRDAGHSPDMVRSSIDELLAADVLSIISILPGTMAVEAAMYASEKNVPLLIISQQEGLMRQGSSIFQLGFSPERQIRELVEAATDKGLKNIAIFYPNIAYGEKMANLFSEALIARGGRVVANVTYNRQSTDFFGDARRLKSDVEASSSGATSGAIAESGALKTVDAVFIPDTFNGVNAAASALEFNQLTGIPLIGTNTWNDPGLSSLIGTTFPGSFFIDLYDSQAESSEVSDFTGKYRSSFGSEPGVLTAMGYDALMMLKASVSASGPKKFKSALASKGYKGVTGIVGFKPGDAPILRPRIIPVDRFVATTE